jgi:hypothetical protein
MAISESSREKLNWLFLESVLIVISILLAFWIDAWWAERQERDNEQVTLQSLLNDLHQKRDLLAENRRRSNLTLDSVNSLLRAASDPGELSGQESIDKLLANLLWVQNENAWESAPINSLTMGGDFSMISNSALRNELASLLVNINRIRGFFRADEFFHQNTLGPYMMRNANLVQIIKSAESQLGDTDAGRILRALQSTKPRDHTGLLSKDDFQGLLYLKMENDLSLVLIGYPRLEQNLGRVIEMLEQELAGQVVRN